MYLNPAQLSAFTFWLAPRKILPISLEKIQLLILYDWIRGWSVRVCSMSFWNFIICKNRFSLKIYVRYTYSFDLTAKFLDSCFFIPSAGTMYRKRTTKSRHWNRIVKSNSEIIYPSCVNFFLNVCVLFCTYQPPDPISYIESWFE